MAGKRSKRKRWDVLAAHPGAVVGAGIPPSRRYDRSILPRPGTEHSVVTSLESHWLVHARVVERQGRFVISYIEVWPRDDNPPSQGITGRDLRAISIADVIPALLRRDRALQRKWGISLLTASSHKRARQARSQQGRRRDDEFHAEVAARYLSALQSHPHKPVAAMTEQYKRLGFDVSAPKVRDWVHAARKQGWLTPGRQGHAGADATRKLERWSQRNNQQPRKRGS
jgi:hypothetical protein